MSTGKVIDMSIKEIEINIDFSKLTPRSNATTKNRESNTPQWCPWCSNMVFSRLNHMKSKCTHPYMMWYNNRIPNDRKYDELKYWKFD